MIDLISLSDGNGGRRTHELIEGLFAISFGMQKPLTDSAVLQTENGYVAFTTDAYVIHPVFFPGGNIGKLAICGTVNDLAVSGAIPRYISASFIIEEGLSVHELKQIVSSMAEEAERAGVRIVTGDTKVVEKGKCDKIFITTSGIGFVREEFKDIASGRKVSAGDKLIINGNLADHSMAVLLARKQLSFQASVQSDCASLNHLIQAVLDQGRQITFMRDITRGGLATVLNELAGMTGKDIVVHEELVPVGDQVRGLCEVFGFDPMYMANEGKVLMVVNDKDADLTVEILRSDPLGRESRIIGEVLPSKGNKVILKTVIGGKRILDMLAGDLLPRIC